MYHHSNNQIILTQYDDPKKRAVKVLIHIQTITDQVCEKVYDLVVFIMLINVKMPTIKITQLIINFR